MPYAFILLITLISILEACKVKNSSSPTPSALKLYGDSEELPSYPSWLVSFSAGCGGAYIGSHQVITAAHCVIHIDPKLYDHNHPTPVPDSSQKLYFALQKQANNQDVQLVQAKITHITALQRYSDVAVISFDHTAFKDQIQQHHLTPPTPIALASHAENISQLHLYGIGQAHFHRGQHEYSRRGGFGAKDRITLHGPQLKTQLLSLKDYERTHDDGFHPRQHVETTPSNLEPAPDTDKKPGPNQEKINALLDRLFGDAKEDPEYKKIVEGSGFFVLALDPAHGVCGGDSGSPITIVRNHTEFLFGVISIMQIIRGHCGSHVISPSIPYFHASLQPLLRQQGTT